MDYATLSLLLLAAGILVVVVEMFIPSAGVLGFVAASCLIASIIVAFMHSIFFGFCILATTSLAMPLLFLMLVKVWPLTPLGKAILMNDTIENILPESDVDKLIDRVGKATTKMLPSGIVEIDGKQHDAVSEGYAIGAGDAVKVISVRGNRIYVEPYSGEVDSDGKALAVDSGKVGNATGRVGHRRRLVRIALKSLLTIHLADARVPGGQKSRYSEGRHFSASRQFAEFVEMNLAPFPSRTIERRIDGSRESMDHDWR